MDADLLWWLLAVLLILAGTAGLLVPMLPGAPLLLGGLVLAAWIEDFAYVGYGTLALLLALAALTYVVDLAAGILGAKRFGASRQALVGAGIGALVGLFMGVIGIIIGPFIGAMLGELANRRGLHAAGRSGLGTTLGLLAGAAAKLALACSMIGIFLLVRFF